MNPTQTERDDSGRLVYVALESALPLLPNAEVWLLLVDGSAHSLLATQEAIRLASSMRSCALHLVNIQPWMSKEAAETQLTELGLQATQASRTQIDAVNFPWQLHLTMGEPVEQIAALAKRLNARAIVMGSHGLGAVKSLLLGSVAQGVIHKAVAPVMVVS